MAQLTPNQLVGFIHGKIGDLVFVKTTDGKVIVRHRPTRDTGATGNELANQSRFAAAAAYVKRTRRQPELYAVYQEAAKGTKKRPCDLAHKDFRHPPLIQEIDVSAYSGKPGEMLRIQAIDDFGVVSVEVVVTDLEGLPIEQGPAVPGGAVSEWVYPGQVLIPVGRTIAVQVTASDRPGNVVTKSVQRYLNS